jgi:hypothetical protein
VDTLYISSEPLLVHVLLVPSSVVLWFERYSVGSTSYDVMGECVDSLMDREGTDGHLV